MNHPQSAVIVASLKNQLDELAYQLEVARAAEAAARDHRIACEEAIIAAVGVRDEGSQTTKTAFYKVTTKGSLLRSLDEKAWREIRDQVPDAIADQVVTYKPSLSAAGVKFIELNEPQLYRLIARAITVKPGKAAVSVERNQPTED